VSKPEDIRFGPPRPLKSIGLGLDRSTGLLTYR